MRCNSTASNRVGGNSDQSSMLLYAKLFISLTNQDCLTHSNHSFGDCDHVGEMLASLIGEGLQLQSSNSSLACLKNRWCKHCHCLISVLWHHLNANTVFSLHIVWLHWQTVFLSISHKFCDYFIFPAVFCVILYVILVCFFSADKNVENVEISYTRNNLGMRV